MKLSSVAFLPFAFALLAPSSYATSAESYNPSWVGELAWTNNNLFNAPPGSVAYLEDQHVPWWQGRVDHPTDYDASKLPAGVLRLDTAVDVEYTIHRTLPGWSTQRVGDDNLYTFTPGSHDQAARTARSGQNAFLDLGFHPISSVSADIGAEAIGNYNQTYWFPLNDEHRMYDNNRHIEIVRGEVKYDDHQNFMIRAFEAVPNLNWVYQNDLFQLLPTQADVEYYRRLDGSLTPRGGEMRYQSPIGTLDVIGGTEYRWGYGSSAYAKYDLPAFGTWENSFVYRNENIPFGLEGSDERRWALSYNSSYAFNDNIATHAGILYQPFRLNTPYQDADQVDPGTGLLGSQYNISQKTTGHKDALGFTARTEVKTPKIVDQIGLGYTYLGPVAGDKQEVDFDATKMVLPAWSFSSAYIYRQPVVGPEPLLFEGTASDMGALLSSPRGPFDPFWVQWDNRKAHILSLTFVYDPTPATPFFRYQKNVLDDWNLNPDEDSVWTGAIQYHMTYYPTDTDRLYYYDASHNLTYDPIFSNGALATTYPFSSATGLLRYTNNGWHSTVSLSGGQSLAGSGTAYIPGSGDFVTPSNTFFSSALSVDNGIIKTFINYAQNVWGPMDYQTQLGLTFHEVYQAGLSYIAIKGLELGFRFVGTRMPNEVGSAASADIGAFNEYNFFATYHFSLLSHVIENAVPAGSPLPKVLPEVSLSVSDTQFTPDGSGPNRTVILYPVAQSDAGILSWHVTIHDRQGNSVKEWQGSGKPPTALVWDGLDSSGKPLPTGVYFMSLDVADLYGNEAKTPVQTVEIKTLPAPVVAVSTPTAAPEPMSTKAYTVTETAEGLRVTLSSLVLFDTAKYNLKPAAKTVLDQVVQLLQAYPSNNIRISGHTDNVGNDAYNQTLSEHRAQTVADYLFHNGVIGKSRFTVVGYGKRRPVASNSTPEGRQQNRRVEIDILK